MKEFLMYLFYMYSYLYVSVWVYAYKTRCSWRSEEDILDLELQVIVSHWAWLLGTKLGSNARAVGAHTF